MWKEKLLELMIEAGREEKRLAKEFYDGVPAITVILDGSDLSRKFQSGIN